jgi:hypothetical protein
LIGWPNDRIPSKAAMWPLIYVMLCACGCPPVRLNRTARVGAAEAADGGHKSTADWPTGFVWASWRRRHKRNCSRKSKHSNKCPLGHRLFIVLRLKRLAISDRSALVASPSRAQILWTQVCAGESKAGGCRGAAEVARSILDIDDQSFSAIRLE